MVSKRQNIRGDLRTRLGFEITIAGTGHRGTAVHKILASIPSLKKKTSEFHFKYSKECKTVQKQWNEVREYEREIWTG